ncbi:MAG TPA: superoxide dismutase [Flavobacteriaceae bacterium]|nr:superoxide dismutase [Flavobacteriaceae bacterium]
MYSLPKLHFDKADLAPIITEEGFDYHHGKHHQAYVNNLNNILKSREAFQEAPIKELIVHARRVSDMPLYNNAAQHYNHDFFWKCLSPNGGGKPTGILLEQIIRDFGSFENFKEKFSMTAASLFGSGWAWLAQDDSGKLEILGMANADTPLIVGKKPILTFDVWEHAYYIDHRNARPKFIDGFWEIVNWDFATSNLIEL